MVGTVKPSKFLLTPKSSCRGRRLARDVRKTTDAALRMRLQIILRYDAGWGAQTIAAALHRAPATRRGR